MINGNKVLGVIGGVGPMATVDFYKKVVELTDASCDQEHIHVLIDGYSQIPDRTASILAGDERPLPYLIDSARRLEAAGAICWSWPATPRIIFLKSWKRPAPFPC